MMGAQHMHSMLIAYDMIEFGSKFRPNTVTAHNRLNYETRHAAIKAHFLSTAVDTFILSLFPLAE